MKKLLLLLPLLTIVSLILPINAMASALATGGTYTEIGGYGIHTFTSSGTFTPSEALTVEYLVVAGGGGGGGNNSTGGGGGGGAGGMRTGSLEVTSQGYTVTVGGGGTGGIANTTTPGVNGSNSVFSTITSIGGGGGGTWIAGSSGGSGGGGGPSAAGAAGTSGQGNNGGSGYNGGAYPGGGGGGKNAVGANASSLVAGNGGAGLASTISGSSISYAGGGGGGCASPNTPGTGGIGGGGSGGQTGPGTAGTTNTGGGGGGGGYSGGSYYNGGAGGSGIVIIRYLLPTPPNVPTIGSATILSDTSIQWNFTDNSDNEIGFMVYDDSNVLKVTCATPNLSSCSETDLTPHTSYTRKVVAYNAGGNSSYSDTDTVSTLATSCIPYPTDSTHVISTNCSFPNNIIDSTDGSRYITGIVAGFSTDNTSVLTINNNTLTILANQTIVAGSIEIIGSGSMAIADGGMVDLDKPVWLIDADADGFPNSIVGYLQAIAPNNGYRLNSFSDISTADCDDNTYSADNNCCIASTYYQDLDDDGYGDPNISDYICPTTGWVADNTDCYDANPATTNAELAYPGSTTCTTSNRGDGSYDYNCSGSGTACGTGYYVSACRYSYYYNDHKERCEGPSCLGNYDNTGAQVSCGTTGYEQSWVWSDDGGGCGGSSGYRLGPTGTQACQ